MESVPHDLDAEEWTLGALLLDGELSPNSAASKIAPILSPDDFYRALNRRVYAAFLRLRRANSPCTTISVARALKEMGIWQDGPGGTMAYLHHLSEQCPTTVHAEYHARIVQDLANRRRVLEDADQMGQRARDPGSPMNTSRAFSWTDR